MNADLFERDTPNYSATTFPPPRRSRTGHTLAARGRQGRPPLPDADEPHRFREKRTWVCASHEALVRAESVRYSSPTAAR